MSVKRPMWLKLAGVSILLAALPTAAVGVGLMNINANSLRTESRDFRLAVAEDIASTMEGDLQLAQRTIASAAHVLGDPQLAGEGRVALIQTLIGLDPVVDFVDVYDAEGKFIDRVSEEGKWLPTTVESWKPGTAPESLISSEDVRLPVVVPIQPRDKAEPTGYVMTLAPLSRVQARAVTIVQQRMPAGSEVSVVDTKNRTLVHSDAARIATPFLDNDVVRDLPQLVEKHVAASGENTATGMLVSAKPLDTIDAAVVVNVPLAAAYRSLYEMRTLVWIATLVAILAAALAAFVVSRILTRPLESLVEFVRSLATRDFTARNNVQTADEVGVLAVALNDAARDLGESEARIVKEVEIRTDLSRYLSKELVENVVAREQDMSLGGAHTTVTVLFADVVRFTPMCERLEPEVVVSILNELFTMLTEIVFRHGGTVDKFIGDCVMAFWGAPKEDPDHAAHALDAAEEMIAWLDIGNARWQKNHQVKIELAIGINSGLAVVGNIGSDTRMEYTAIGNPVNIAARLEALARPQQILTTKHTCDLAGSRYDFQRVGNEPIGANQGLIEIFEVLI
ncbi:MAG: adenylate/guanylate cyclase domain-containing protein [bacterium]